MDNVYIVLMAVGVLGFLAVAVALHGLWTKPY
jgi:hypothetical protein